MCFLPRDEAKRIEVEGVVETTVQAEGLQVIGWRDVPVDTAQAGERALAAAPCIRQLFVGAGALAEDPDALERRLYVIRRLIELEAGTDIAIPSFSSRTVVYKGMLSAPQLSGFYTDLDDSRMASALAIVHSRFSTNTFPSWELAHPYRMLAHNGEINTVQGNENWMRAREARLAAGPLGEDVQRILPVIGEGAARTPPRSTPCSSCW